MIKTVQMTPAVIVGVKILSKTVSIIAVINSTNAAIVEPRKFLNPSKSTAKSEKRKSSALTKNVQV